MRIPDSLESLVEHGILEEVLRPLMSGKEAQVYLVVSNGEERVAKVYKEAQDRTFKNRAEYTEGRRVRSSRDQRAMEKRSRYGRAQDEAAWRSTEVEMIYRLNDAGVRVPRPHHFIDGVLIMELIRDAEGNPAPRLGDCVLTAAEATKVFRQLLGEVVRMLCAGVVHGDLSDFNVLMGEHAPVIIDFPQAVNASGNQNARRILLRDVANLQRFVQRYVPNSPAAHYAEEMWQLYERNQLTPDTKLTGRYRGASRPVSTDAVLSLVQDAEHDERRRRQGLGLNMRGVPRPQQSQGDRARSAPQRTGSGSSRHHAPVQPSKRPVQQQPAARSDGAQRAARGHARREQVPADQARVPQKQTQAGEARGGQHGEVEQATRERDHASQHAQATHASERVPSGRSPTGSSSDR